MKKIIALLLLGACLLAGCNMEQDTTVGTGQETVPDLFTQPSTTATEPETSAGQATRPTLPERDIPTFIGLSFEEQEITYAGGELHVTVNVLSPIGYSTVGLGLLLYIDGQPQPYKTVEEDTYSYMHIFYPEEQVDSAYELIFTPVAGEAGEVADMWIASVADPTFFLGDGEVGPQHTRGATSVGAVIRFEATPPEQELPDVENILLDWSCTYEDAGPAEIGSWTAEQLKREIGFRFSVNNRKNSWNFFGITSEDTIKIKFEIWGMPYVKYGFVIYVDNQPVSVSGEDIMLIEIKNGQKAVIEAEISLEKFDGSSVIYAELIPCNSKNCGVENSLWLEKMETYYFSSAASYEDLLAEKQG